MLQEKVKCSARQKSKLLETAVVKRVAAEGSLTVKGNADPSLKPERFAIVKVSFCPGDHIEHLMDF